MRSRDTLCHECCLFSVRHGVTQQLKELRDRLNGWSQQFWSFVKIYHLGRVVVAVIIGMRDDRKGLAVFGSGYFMYLIHI